MTDLDEIIEQFEELLEPERRGRRGYREKKPEGQINFTKFDDELHRWILTFVRNKGYSLGMFYYGLCKWIKSQEEIKQHLQKVNVVDVAIKILVPNITADKEKIMSWGKSLSMAEKKLMEKRFMWDYKIFRALTQGEKDLDNWSYIGRTY